MERLTTQERTRFLGYINKTDGCWLWNGPLDRDGYGTFWFRRKNRRAHRVSYWASVGDVPDKTVIDHICANPNCVNPDHLRALSAKENTLRGNGIPAQNARKTHCPRGHEYDRIYGNQRYCSTCEAAKTKRLRAKWRAEDTVAC